VKELIIKIDPEFLPIHNAILFVNNERIPINQSTDLQLKLNLEENYLRINDAGTRLKPIKIIVFEGEKNMYLLD